MFGKHSNHGNGNNTTIIGRGARFKGTLELEGDVLIEGQCEGIIRSEAQLSIGPHGSVSGELSGGVVVIAGRVEGTAIAKETMHVLNTGCLQGDVFYGQLQVDSGGIIDGRSHQGAPPGMGATNLAPEAARQPEEDSHDDSVIIDTRAKLSSVAPPAAGVARSNAPGRR
jgi:cytoskeletal protein CcmA (bactofilin family)